MKHRFSIKMKVTLWYTAFMLMLMVLVMGVVLVSAEQLLQVRAENELTHAVDDFNEDVNWVDGTIHADEDLDFNEDGISLVVYRTEGERLGGDEPLGFPVTPFVSQQARTIEHNGSEWLIYDMPSGDGWVRGILSMRPIASATNVIILITFVILPFLLIIAAVGGYLITKRAFKPVEKMMSAVGSINSGNDLSKRIELPKTQDEMAKLAGTFNGMFDRLQHSFEKERQFTSDASHELRTPTTVIISEAEYALGQEDNPDKMRDSLEVILRQGKKMFALVAQLLMLSRSDRQMNQVHAEQVDLSELADIVIEELTETANEAQIEIRQNIETGLVLNADQTMMMRLLVNLLSNAITYGKSGGWVQMDLYREGDSVVGKIADNGIGIGSEHVDRIWDRFYRVDPSRTAKNSHNMGLGLAMVQSIVERHSGEIKVESELGEGSCFTFKLPIRGEKEPEMN